MENVDAAELPAAVGWARGAVIDVQRSRITIAIPARVPRSAPFSVVEASGAEVTLAIERGDGALDTARFSLDQPDRIRWHIGDGRAVVMRREGTRPARLD